MTVEPLELREFTLNVPMTKSLERLLNRAASNRNLSSETLAQQILRDWLLATGGFAKTGTSSRRAIHEIRADREHAPRD